MKTHTEPRVLVEEPLSVNGHATKQAKPKAALKVRLAWWLMLAAGFGFIGAGIYTFARGVDARGKVAAEFTAQNITTPEDASIPNAPVVDAATAQSQADIIWTHMLNATEGKTYAELDREDPARATALNGSMLRSSLLSGVLAWNVANLVMGLGAFIAAVGVLLLIGVFVIRPTATRAA